MASLPGIRPISGRQIRQNNMRERAGMSKPDWGNWSDDAPYGDDPDDQRAIRKGIEYARQNGY